MKRTKNINRSRFRKSFLGVAVAVAMTFSLSACEKADETVKFYQNSEQCATETGNTLEQCKKAEDDAKKVAAETAPKFGSLAECQAEFGDMCQQSNNNSGGGGGGDSSWMPLMMGYMMGSMMNSGSNNYYQQSSPMYKSKSGKYMDNKFRSYNVTPGKTFKVSKSAIKPTAQPVKKADSPKSSAAKSKTVTRSGFGSSTSRSSFGG